MAFVTIMTTQIVKQKFCIQHTSPGSQLTSSGGEVMPASFGYLLTLWFSMFFICRPPKSVLNGGTDPFELYE